MIGISAFDLIRAKDLNQLSFFDKDLIKKSSLDNSLDLMRRKYGYCIIRRGTIMPSLDVADIFDGQEFLPFKR
jgi:hypothetical protein